MLTFRMWLVALLVFLVLLLVPAVRLWGRGDSDVVETQGQVFYCRLDEQADNVTFHTSQLWFLDSHIHDLRDIYIIEDFHDAAGNNQRLCTHLLLYNDFFFQAMGTSDVTTGYDRSVFPGSAWRNAACINGDLTTPTPAPPDASGISTVYLPPERLYEDREATIAIPTNLLLYPVLDFLLPAPTDDPTVSPQPLENRLSGYRYDVPLSAITTTLQEEDDQEDERDYIAFPLYQWEQSQKEALKNYFLSVSGLRLATVADAETVIGANANTPVESNPYVESSGRNMYLVLENDAGQIELTLRLLSREQVLRITARIESSLPTTEGERPPPTFGPSISSISGSSLHALLEALETQGGEQVVGYVVNNIIELYVYHWEEADIYWFLEWRSDLGNSGQLRNLPGIHQPDCDEDVFLPEWARTDQ